MTIQEFQKDYYCICTLKQDNTDIIVESKIIKRSNQVIIRTEISKISKQVISDYIINNHLAIGAVQETKEELIDQEKRIHLDIFARQLPIVDFFPRNNSVDISNIYA